MNARKCVHAQKPYEERKRDRKDRGQESDGKKAAQQNKNTLELKQGLPTETQAEGNKEGGGERLTCPSHRR